MVHRCIKLAVAGSLVATLGYESQASMRMYISQGEGWTLNGNVMSDPTGAGWHRKRGLELMRQGVSIMDSAWVDSIYKAKSDEPPFVKYFQNNPPFDNFLVYGKAEQFKLLPGMATGDYTFQVKADDALFLLLDGEVLGSNVGICLRNDDGTGCPEPFVKPQNYTFTKRLEAGKNYNFEFYYWQASQSAEARVFFGPVGGTMGDIPSAIFGERKQFGTPRVSLALVGNAYGASPHSIKFKASPEDTRGEELKYLWDFNGDETVDMETDGPELSRELVHNCANEPGPSCDELKKFDTRVRIKLQSTGTLSAWSTHQSVLVLSSDTPPSSIRGNAARSAPGFVKPVSGVLSLEKPEMVRLYGLDGTTVYENQTVQVDLRVAVGRGGVYFLKVGNRPAGRIVLPN